jgi:hypothetical protein
VTSGQSDSNDLIQISQSDLFQLRESLKDAEHQNELLNLEYSKLLREKDEELRNLQKCIDGNAEVARLKEELIAKETLIKVNNLRITALQICRN